MEPNRLARRLARMLSASLLVAACGSTTGGPGGGPQLAQGIETRFASLDSAQETTGSTSQAKGAGLLSFDPATGRIAGFLVSQGVEATAAHVHLGGRGTAGGILVPLEGGPSLFTVPDGATLPPANAGDFEAGNLYFNVHSAAFSEGEIRGQLDLKPTGLWLASLDGAQETPSNGSTAKGGGILAVDAATQRIAGFISSEGVQGTAAHIHAAARGTAGPIVVPLEGGPALFTIPDQATLPAESAQALDAGELYYNVHSAGYPEGEIRGQLDLEATTTRLASLDAAQETPPNASAAKGAGILGLDEATGRVSGFAVSTGLTGTAAHIHRAERGVAGPIILPLVGGPGTWAVPDGTTLPGLDGDLYYNIHSTAYPEGEIRGQLDRP